MQGTIKGRLGSTVGWTLKWLLSAARRSARLSPKGGGQQGYLLIWVILIIGIGSLVVPATLGYGIVSLRGTSRALDDVAEYYAADAAVMAVTADLVQGVDILAPEYTSPATVVNGLTPTVCVGAGTAAPEPPVQYRYFDPRASGGLNPLAAGEHFTYQTDNVVPSRDFQVNWAFTPVVLPWKLTLYLGSGTTGPVVATNSGEASPGWLTVPAEEIAGGTYTIDFENTSGSSTNSLSFSASGFPTKTWAYTTARKDYLVVVTAGGTTVTAYVRQGPGPKTPPDALPAVTIESWRAPETTTP